MKLLTLSNFVLSLPQQIFVTWTTENYVFRHLQSVKGDHTKAIITAFLASTFWLHPWLALNFSVVYLKTIFIVHLYTTQLYDFIFSLKSVPNLFCDWHRFGRPRKKFSCFLRLHQHTNLLIIIDDMLPGRFVGFRDLQNAHMIFWPTNNNNNVQCWMSAKSDYDTSYKSVCIDRCAIKISDCMFITI